MRPWLGPGAAKSCMGLEGLLMGFDQYAFGKRFKELRRKRKLTQEQLADRLGITDRHIRGIERGDFFPSIDLYILIAEVFEIPLDTLILGRAIPLSDAELLEQLHQRDLLQQHVKESIQRVASELYRIAGKI